MSISEEFARAVELVTNGDFAISDENKLKLYAYYKIANNHLLDNEQQPFFLNMVAMAKWNARRTAERLCTSQHDAMQKYMDLVAVVTSKNDY